MRSVKSRLWAGVALIVVAGIAILVALGPLRFSHRFSDRVDVVGTVKDGFDLEAADGTPTEDGTYGIWQIDYSLRGSDHVGFIIGSYRTGEQVEVSVPGDGSVYGPLVPSVSTFGKIMSWPLMLLGIPALLIGLGMLAMAIRARNRQLRADTRQTLLRLGFPEAAVATEPSPPDPTWQSTTPGSAPSSAPQVESPYADPLQAEPPPADRQNPFFKPYDL